MKGDEMRSSARGLAREAHARGCHCMPVTDDDGNLCFTSRDDRCEQFAKELTAAIEGELEAVTRERDRLRERVATLEGKPQ